MPENENENKNGAPEIDHKISANSGKKVSVLENARIINEKARKKELEEESRLSAEIAEKERAQREKYSKKLAEERIELMKLKQGMISEEDMPKEEEAPPKEYTLSEKLENFIYHNKIYLVIGGAIVLLAVFLVYDYVTNKKPDVNMLVIARNAEFVTRTYDIEELLEPYCRDFNGDGIVYLQVSYIPAVVDENNGMDVYYSTADQTRLIAEFQTVDSIMLLTDDEASEALDIYTTYADLREHYSGSSAVTEHGYLLSKTKLPEEIGFPDMPEDYYLSFRRPFGGAGVNEKKFRQNYENALEVWDNYLNGNAVSEDMPLYSDKRKNR